MKMLLPGERFGLIKGRQETLREGVLVILEARFRDVPYALREKVQAIQAESRLKKLLCQAALAESLKAFANDL